MSELIPLKAPSNTWHGFALRVAIIAVAASVVLGIASLLGWTLEPSRRPAVTPDHTTQNPVP